MGKQLLISLLSVVLISCQIASFSISSRQERSTDLADALAILQRQRRRAVTDYLTSDRLLNNEPYTLDEDADWLRAADVGENSRNGLENAWESNGRFIDIQTPIEYDIPLDRARGSVPVAIEPSRQELEDIFDADDIDGNISQPKINPGSLPEKKKKEEALSVKGDGRVVQKKSYNPLVEEAVVATPVKQGDSNDGISLDTLTKEEFHALMKAVDKLQKQAVKFSEKTIETPEAKVTKVEAIESNGDPKAITIVQPASKEELKAVFDGEETPVVKETEVVVEREPNESGERIIEKQVMSNLSPSKANELKEKELDLINVIASELEDNIEAENENEEERDIINAENLNEAGRSNIEGIKRQWLNRKYQNPTQKRTIKRAASFEPVRGPSIDADELAEEINANNNEELDDLEVAAVTPNLEQFVAKILELQDEVDNLKIVSRLEDLENDVLTDALNEATLAQKEGSVTDMEFESLQQAIRIEEALQKLKNDDSSKGYQGEELKRGEPWRKKRGQGSDDIETALYPVERPTSYSVLPESELELSPLDNDLQGIIVEPNIIQESDPDADVASFFISNADECPAVQEYSTNCELADLYSLPVDFEARSLCNLHEMCYACGKSLQVGQEQCDLVYRAAAAALCRGKENCVVESEIFLRTMKLKNRYIPHSQPLCRSTCVAQFLGML